MERDLSKVLRDNRLDVYVYPSYNYKQFLVVLCVVRLFVLLQTETSLTKCKQRFCTNMKTNSSMQWAKKQTFTIKLQLRKTYMFE